jgi:hypothetical protein
MTSPVYATNKAGEVLPLMYIFDFDAKNDFNFCVMLTWLVGLPTVTSFYATRTERSMDDSKMNNYIDNVLLPFFPNNSEHAQFEFNGTLLRS